MLHVSTYINNGFVEVGRVTDPLVRELLTERLLDAVVARLARCSVVVRRTFPRKHSFVTRAESLGN